MKDGTSVVPVLTEDSSVVVVENFRIDSERVVSSRGFTVIVVVDLSRAFTVVVGLSRDVAVVVVVGLSKGFTVVVEGLAET